MEKRFKVLISAYACEPGKGSEPEVGWQWAWQMARFHEVTVLTRANNRPAIEAEVPRTTGSRPQFVYFDLSFPFLKCKRHFQLHRFYYHLWQRQARKVVGRMVRREKFDLLHHVTFATFRHPTAIWGLGVPSIWGPVGGAESVPSQLLPWSHPGALVSEIVRNLDNAWQTSRFGGLRRRAGQSTLVLASTRQMQAAFRDRGVAAKLMPTIGLHTANFPVPPRSVRRGPLRLLFVGNLLPLKGLDFGLKALKASETDARLTLIGAGPFRKDLERLASKLGLKERVEFRGHLPRDHALAAYRDFDVCLFPSLHDTGGYAVIEAMCNALPTICLAAGGPGTAIQAGCGISIPLGSRAAVVNRLAEAIRSYDRDRERIFKDGGTARRNVEENYDWERKAAVMNEFYREVAS